MGGVGDEGEERVRALNGTLRAKVGLNADCGLLSRLMRRDLRFADVLSCGYVSLEAVSSSESCVRSLWADSRRRCVHVRWKEGSCDGGKRRSRPSLKSKLSASALFQFSRTRVRLFMTYLSSPSTSL